MANTIVIPTVFDNPDKTVNIDRFDSTNPWWLVDNPYLKNTVVTASVPVAAAQLVPVVAWPIQSAGVFGHIFPYTALTLMVRL